MFVPMNVTTLDASITRVLRRITPRSVAILMIRGTTRRSILPFGRKRRYLLHVHFGLQGTNGGIEQYRNKTVKNLVPRCAGGTTNIIFFDLHSPVLRTNRVGNRLYTLKICPEIRNIVATVLLITVVVIEIVISEIDVVVIDIVIFDREVVVYKCKIIALVVFLS